MTVKEFLVHASAELGEVSTLPELDAELLLASVMDKQRSYLIAHSEERLSIQDEQHTNNLISRRANGEPVAYLLHQKEFYGRPFYVDERVLIPRPKTETIIDEVIKLVAARTLATPRILDLGTGSGCIAITLAKEITDADIVATDISSDALHVASQNAKGHEAEMKFLRGDLFEALAPLEDKTFDIIVANPPYVDKEKTHGTVKATRSLAFEPRQALYAPGADPLALVHAVITDAPHYLRADGSLYVEIQYDQGERVASMAKNIFPTHNIQVHKNFQGQDSIVSIIAN